MGLSELPWIHDTRVQPRTQHSILVPSSSNLSAPSPEMVPKSERGWYSVLFIIGHSLSHILSTLASCESLWSLLSIPTRGFFPSIYNQLLPDWIWGCATEKCSCLVLSTFWKANVWGGQRPQWQIDCWCLAKWVWYAHQIAFQYLHLSDHLMIVISVGMVPCGFDFHFPHK